MRRYAIHSAYNLRDLGGYPTKSGIYTGYGKLLRSECPESLIEEDLEQLNTLGVEAVIDLRAPRECASRPSPYRLLSDVAYHHIGFKTGDLAPVTEEDIPRGYLAMMEEAETVVKVLEIIVNTERSVLFHCAVGKDRTGIITAIVLSLCQVPMPDILADYQVSYTYLKPLIEAYKKIHPTMPEWVGMSKESYLIDTFSLINQKYGSFEGYLKAIKLEREVIVKLQQKMCF